MSAFVIAGVYCLLVAFIPGALFFRIPDRSRPARAALSVEERFFWAVATSVALSSLVGLALAIAGRYQFQRLLWTDAAVAAGVGLLFRGRLRYGGTSAAPTWTIAIPAALVLGAALLYFQVPPSEYVMGGKDPGVYMTEGVRIAQRGGVVDSDEVVRTIPQPFRNLFFPLGDAVGYESSRFMGYFLLKASTGRVVGQFPPGFPMWVAIGYGVDGLNGARAMPVFGALFGLLAVYFAAARLFGRAAAAAGAALLAVNVVQLWYARYPSAEIFLQPLVFAGLLGYLRAVRDKQPFFAPIAALLFVVGAFTHLTGLLVAGVVGGTALFDSVAARRRVPRSFWIPLGIGTIAAGVFLWRVIPPYFQVPLEFVENLRTSHIALGLAALVLGGGLLVWLRQLSASTRDQVTAAGLIAVVWLLAGYAYFIRTAGGALAPHDADSLRTFTSFYLSPLGLALALIGFAVATTAIGDSFGFLLLVAALSIAFFFKIRIVPEHFWAARRFLAITLPGALVLVGAAAFADVRSAGDHIPAGLRRTGTTRLRVAVGLALILFIGWRYAKADTPLVQHVEYAGLIPHLEEMAATFGDNDLVLFESRGASDSHVLALPLAYIYARNVLVFNRAEPSKEMFREFLAWALTKYTRVFFVGGGGGGTELLSRSITVTAVRGERFQIPEYESALNAYPSGVRRKEFDLSIYEFRREPVTSDVIAIDIGATDDLYVRRFYAKEQSPGGFSLRWTRDISFVSAVGIRPEHRTVTMWMGTGGRPPGAGAAVVTVYLQERRLGQVTVGDGIAPYRFDIPADLAATLGQSDSAATLRLDTTTWSPAKLLGVGDTRELGVMLDRLEIR